jgi:hypothetical protein
MDVVGISLGGTPGCGVSIDGGTSVVEDSHVVEGEGTGRSGCRAVIGDAACTRTSASHGSRSRPGNLSISSDLASEATRVLPLVRPELDPESPGLTGGREDLSNSIFECSINFLGHPLDPQEISLENVKGLAPDVHLLVGGHLDLPVALGLVGVVLGVVGTLDGYLLSISEVSLSVLAFQGFHLIPCDEGLLGRPCICSLK